MMPVDEKMAGEASPQYDEEAARRGASAALTVFVMFALLIIMLLIAIPNAAPAHADDNDLNDPVCREITARIADATGGTFERGNLSNTIRVADYRINIFCNGEETKIVADSDTLYPPNIFFNIAGTAGQQLTGDPANVIESGVRKCFNMALKNREWAEIDWHKTHFACHQAAGFIIRMELIPNEPAPADRFTKEDCDFWKNTCRR
jgi:hypothetical protein